MNPLANHLTNHVAGYLRLIRIATLIAAAASIAVITDGLVESITCCVILGLTASIIRETTRAETPSKRHGPSKP